MARVLRRLCAVATVFGALALVLGTQPWASAASSDLSPVPTLSGWSTLQDQALQAVSGAGGAGPLEVRALGPVRTGALTTAAGTVSLAERTVVASGASGPLVMVLSWLGGTQLVVTEVSPGDPSANQALVLVPGSARVQGRYALGRAQDIASAAVVRRGALRARDAVLQVGSRRRSTARLASTYGCAGLPQAPTVIGSIYGPLIQGTGVISCPYYETLALVVGLYEWGTQIGTASGSAYGSTFYALNVYHACTLISGSNAFKTAQLWSVNGSLYGSTSSTSYLGCA